MRHAVYTAHSYAVVPNSLTSVLRFVVNGRRTVHRRCTVDYTQFSKSMAQNESDRSHFVRELCILELSGSSTVPNDPGRAGGAQSQFSPEETFTE